MNPLAEKIKEAVSKGLPGTNVQWEMASSDRMIRDFPRVKKTNSKLAAVLILLYPSDHSICTFLIQRPVYNGVHSGQISFPGGKAEKDDHDLTHTALREASEEAGIDSRQVEVLGVLTPLYIPVSDTEVTPVVGWTDQKPEFKIDATEVVNIIEADMATLSNPDLVKEKPLPVRGEMMNVRYYDLNGVVIWGATAMIFHEFITILRREKIPFTL
jgi:8-oxo-dGTP pyrophosphatase MutT (NUDIX family)